MKSATQRNLVPQVIDLIGVEFSEKYARYLRMANVIVHLTRKNGGCLPQDLLPLGFSKEETTELWHMANAMADVELKLKNRGPYLISSARNNI